MCGIAGIFRTADVRGSVDQIIAPDFLTKMRDTMSHRGPDDAGLYISPEKEIGLVHRRLSIIDLSSAAVQPMTNQDESLWIVFNGEIYNHAELRKELMALGRQFRTDHSDTEVIIKGYEQWGEDVLPRLRGMFAFVIWDRQKKRLWMARDRMGVKPLYYTHVGGLFVFASEIKAILEVPGVTRECHDRAFYDFMTFLVSPAPQTLFKNIYKLPAGHTLTVEASGRQSLKRYWNPFTGVGKIEQRSDDDWAESIVDSLRESIRYRMVSDVKFGVFLSGGIDSSTNVALMAEQMSRPVETFSIGFKGADKFNELNYARMVVNRYKTNHHEVIIDSSDLIRFLPQLVHHQDEPIVDPVCVPVYYVSKLAKDNGTTVCQVGEGADELFCGYPYWSMVVKTQPWARRYQKLPAPLRHLLWSVANATFQAPRRGMRQLDMFRRASLGQPLFWGGAEAYQETTKQRLLSKSFLQRLGGYTSYETIRKFQADFETDAPPEADDLHWMTYLDLRFRLPELLLMRVDKMTMANAVEARVPFLDQEFIKLSMAIPQSVKFKNNTLKYILKKAVDPILPPEIIYRRKQGFAVPVNEWFQAKLADWANKKIIDFSKRTDFFDPQAVKAFLSSSNSKVSWFLLNFVLWHEMWIENKDLELPA